MKASSVALGMIALVSLTRVQSEFIRVPLQSDRRPIERPGIRLVSDKQGIYEITWIGGDRKKKTTTFQAPDRIDVIVSATVSEIAGGRYRYHYGVDNLTTSGQTLAYIFVQTFSQSVILVRQPDVYAGPSSNNAIFKLGSWYGISPLPERRPPVSPGSTFSFDLESVDPPGLVECRASGSRGVYEGVGEDMPEDLARALPGREAYPRGSTLGPIDRLKSLTSTERSQQVLQWLESFEHLGWMSHATRLRYQETLRTRGLAVLAGVQQSDLDRKLIAPEVATIVRTMAR